MHSTVTGCLAPVDEFSYKLGSVYRTFRPQIPFITFALVFD